MILSIESSCDDSSIAITEINSKKLIFHKKISQDIEHSLYGGVVPELAARLHIEALPKILEQCLEYIPNLKAIAVTSTPGLSVTLLEGIMMAKALSITLKLPLIAVNHLKGHIYSLFIEKDDIFPITILLVSGGHTQIIKAENLNNMEVIASTMDDSFGESFDKVSRMLDLGYPGGPIIQEYSIQGDDKSYNFPIPLRNSPNIEFSYSGLKNAVRLAIQKEDILTKEIKQNICASFQKSAIEHITMKLKKYFKQNIISTLAIVGGASANLRLRTEVEMICKKYDTKLLLAPLEFCSDNAVMIGRISIEQYKLKEFISIEKLDIKNKKKKNNQLL